MKHPGLSIVQMTEKLRLCSLRSDRRTDSIGLKKERPDVMQKKFIFEKKKTLKLILSGFTLLFSACITKPNVKEFGEEPVNNDPLEERKLEDPRLQEITSQIDLQLTRIKKERSYWAEGTLVGIRGKAVAHWFSYDVDFVAFAGYPGGDTGVYHPVTTKISPWNEAIYEKYKDATGVVALKYVRRHPWNPMNLISNANSRLFVYDVINVKDMTQNSLNLKKEFVEDPSLGRGWSASGDYLGYISHIQRWGYIGPVCTIYLNEGSDKEITIWRKQARAGGVWKLGGVDGVNLYNPLTLFPKLEAGVGVASQSINVPNINEYVVYSNEGCDYAEAVAKTRSKVRLDISKKFIDLWHSNKYVVHKMTIEDPL